MKKISFRKMSRTEEKVFLNDICIGSVVLDVWRSKWSLRPIFKSRGRDIDFEEKFCSAYKAGKVMVELYEKINNKNKKAFDPLDDTEEFLLKGLFDNIGP